MPQVAVGAVLAGVVSGSVISAGVLTVGFSISAFAGSLILGGLSYALTPKPKKSSFDPGAQPPGNVAVRQSDLTRTHVYGNTRSVRGFAHMVSTNNNKDLHLIIMLCEGELRAINEVWMDDYCIPPDWIDADGKVTQGRYANYLTIRKHVGTPDQMADTLAISNIPDWTVNHRLQGIAYLYCILNRNQDVYPSGVPNISAIVDGPTIFDPRVGEKVWTSNVALFAYDFITADYGYAADDDDVNLDNIAAQANICDEIVTVTDLPIAATAVAPTTNIITLTGDILTLEYGDMVHVSSTGTLPSGLSAATDYFVIPYQVKTTPRILLATSLDNAMARTAIDITTAGTGTLTVTKKGEPRYHGGGEVDTVDDLAQTLNNLVNSMAGRAINVAGEWTLLAGAWREPVLNLTQDDMRGSGLNYKNGLSMSDSYNRVKGLFTGPATNYQPTDYPIATYQTFLDQDLGIEATKELNLPYTSRATTAQRIGKIELFRGRQDIAYSSDYSTKLLQEQPGGVITKTLDRTGWEEKPFEITTMSLDATENGLIVKAGFRETAQAIYDWSAGEAVDYDPAPNTSLTNPFDVMIVGGFSFNSRLIETSDGDSIYTLTGKWEEHPDAFVREYGGFEIQFRLSDIANGPEDNWSPGYFVDGHLTASDIVTASVGKLYDLRIRARNNLGVRSPWSNIYNATVGSSGGVVTTDDWLLVTGSPTVFKDWGNVTDAPSSFEDWGFVV